MKGLAVRLLPYVLSFFSSLCIMILELVASRLVARHVGASLMVWTSVIGIMLGGICLGNVLGGRLADRVEPYKAIGPLYALGAFLTLSCLWVNAVVGLTPGLDHLAWSLRTVVVVVLDFLVPGTVLGMIGPVVAKIAVEQARKAGSAIGDVYFWGAVGSIAGTFLAGFVLLYIAAVSTIVTLVGAALALLAASLLDERRARALAVLSALFLALGSVNPLVRGLHVGGLPLGSTAINFIALPGHLLAVALAVEAGVRLWTARQAAPSEAPNAEDMLSGDMAQLQPRLGDLAALAFMASLAFMALEMVAGRLVTRHLGSSVYGWTSVIGVLLGGLSVGNYLGGKIADYVQSEKRASWLFLAASLMTLFVLWTETPRFFGHDVFGFEKSVLSQAISWTKVSIPGLGEVHMGWPTRVLLVTAIVFFVPSVTMGAVSPVVAKLAVERVRRSKRTGTAIGQVYAWGMVGSIVGTFLTGFVLIDVLGTKGVLLVLATALAFAATALGSVWHALWAGLPLGMCVIAFIPIARFERLGVNHGLREEMGSPSTTEDALAWVDESNYYYIKVTNEPDQEGQKRTLVLDNLIHGYFILGHPERLDYDYEHIYGLVADRIAKGKAAADKAAKKDWSPLKTLFLGGGAYTFQRYMQHTYAGTEVDVAEIDPAVTRANFNALGLPRDTTITTTWGDARQFVERHQHGKKYDIVFGDAFNDFSVPWHLTTEEFNTKLANMITPDGVYMINIIDAYESDAKAERAAVRRAKKENVTSEAGQARIRREELARAHRFGGFLGAWVKTAKKTFPYVYIFGTDEPGSGLRETFVVVASKKELSLGDLGERDEDPKFFNNDMLVQPKPYGPEDQAAVDQRARGIILTDDYAPVENLLAPVAETRGED